MCTGSSCAGARCSGRAAAWRRHPTWHRPSKASSPRKAQLKAPTQRAWHWACASWQRPIWTAAAATFERLQQLAPLQPEPADNLGVIRTMQGDTGGAAAALATLESRNAPLAASLRAYMAACLGPNQGHDAVRDNALA